MWIMTAAAAPSGLVLLTGPIREHHDLPTTPVARRTAAPARRTD
jgi:hypothetical protein